MLSEMKTSVVMFFYFFTPQKKNPVTVRVCGTKTKGDNNTIIKAPFIRLVIQTKKITIKLKL